MTQYCDGGVETESFSYIPINNDTDLWHEFNRSRDGTSMNFTEETVTTVMLADWEHILAVFLYSALSILAIGGNCCVIYLIFYVKKLRTPTNLLIANLALADVLMACLCIPFSYWPVLVLQYWPFGLVMCKIINPAQAVAVFLSSYTLVAISFDRFLAIMFPLKPSLRLTHTSALWVILLVWILAIILAIPLIIVMDVCIHPKDNLMWCDEMWINVLQDGKRAYDLSIFLLQYLVPVLVLVVTYTGIGLRIWFTRVPGDSSADKNRRDSVRQMIPMMVLVTALYALCWLPQNIFTNIPWPDSLYDHPHILRIWWVVHFTAMFHSTVNPVIYYCRNEHFHNGFRYLFRWLPRVKHRPINGRTTYYSQISHGPFNRQNTLEMVQK